jgi:transcriptional regulator with XRE-family HTH domain
MDIGREIRRLREEKGWSQAKLAGAADMGTSGISQIETGARNPSAVTLSKIAEALGVGVADLFPKGLSSSPEPTFNDVLDDEQRLALMKSLEDEIRHFTARWHDELKNAQDQDRYWHAGILVLATGYTDIIARRDLLRKVNGIGNLSKQEQRQKIIANHSDPEFQAAMQLMGAWAYMSKAADEVDEAAGGLWGAWIVREEAEQRRRAFSVIQGDLSA